MVKLCEYGCGREAKHQFKNGKWCCSISCNSCSAKRSSGFKHLQKTKEKIGVKNKLTIEKIQKIYPIFIKTLNINLFGVFFCLNIYNL